MWYSQIFFLVLLLTTIPVLCDPVLVDGWKPIADVTGGITSDPNFRQSGWTGEPGQLAGAQFTLSESRVITGVHFVGFYHNAVTSDSFTFELYAGRNKNPLQLLATMTAININRSATTTTSISGDGAIVYEYWVDLADFNIGPGNYILSIVNDPLNDNWAWAASRGGGDGASYYRHPVYNWDWNLNSQLGLSYQITGQAAPESSTFLLLSGGLIGLGVLGGRIRIAQR